MGDERDTNIEATSPHDDGSAQIGGSDPDPGKSLSQGKDKIDGRKSAKGDGKKARLGKVKKWFQRGKDQHTILAWRDDRGTIARIIPREIMAEQLFFRTKVTIHPGEALLVMEKGRMAAPAITEGQMISDGFIDRIKKSLGFGKDVVMLAVDTGNLTLRITAGLSKYQLIYNDPQLAEKMGITRYGADKNADSMQEIENFFKDIIWEGKDAVHSQDNQKKKSELNKFIKERYGFDFADEHNKTPLLSKDRESIVLDVKLQINIRTNDITEIYKLVTKEKDGKLTVKALESLLGQELSVRVFAPRICKHTADELRSQPAIIEEMQRNAQEELGKWLSGYGIDLMRLSLNPAITDYERAAVIEKEISALDELAKAQQSHLKDEAQREYELAVLRLNQKQALLKAKKEGDEELTAIANASKLTDKGRELSIEEIETQIKLLRLDVSTKEREAQFLMKKLDEELAWDIHQRKRLLGQNLRSQTLKDKTDNDIRVWMVKAKIYQEQKQAQLAEMEKRLQIEVQSQQHVEKIIEKGAHAGALTGKNLTEAIQQTTVRKALDQTDPVAQSFADAEGQRHAKEIFIEGLHQQPTIGLSGKEVKMFASKSFDPHKMISMQEEDIARSLCPQCKTVNPIDARICGYCKEPMNSRSEDKTRNE